MDPLIVQFDDAASADYCERPIQRFEDAPEKSAGRAGVDKDKKDSSDLYLSTLP
ncbi:hypothetical protein [Microbulbifer hainanensis]|uniref:hypothetical protein n=1 Tax=Microbulbifer hainanensis TaxID=2735675 RepID=UPI0018679854|nr:hypothetical protein [Microbulbifer hainanensis]